MATAMAARQLRAESWEGSLWLDDVLQLQTGTETGSEEWHDSPRGTDSASAQKLGHEVATIDPARADPEAKDLRPLIV